MQMLKALYDYGIANSDIPIGYRRKNISAYIRLSKNGEFVGIEIPDNKRIVAPDIGSLSLGTIASNVLIEKRGIVLGEDSKYKAKTLFFKNVFVNGKQDVPAFSACECALSNDETVNLIKQECDKHNISDGDMVGFIVDGIIVHDSQETLDWWKKVRIYPPFIKEDRAKDLKTSNSIIVDIVTGELIEHSIDTCQKMSGLVSVGGAATGDRLMCFDKPAFQSYGLERMENAQMSEETNSKIVCALEELSEKAPILAGVKYIHWYNSDIKDDKDPFLDIFSDFSNESDDSDENDKVTEEIQKRLAEDAADNLINSIKNGETAPELKALYYIIGISAYSGRVRIRKYDVGKYADLKMNVDKWNADISLSEVFTNGLAKQQKLSKRFLELVNYEGKPNIWKAVDSELSGIAPMVIDAIISNRAIPDTIAVKALQRIRTKMYQNSTNFIPDTILCQWLKVWLIRKKGENIMAELDSSNENVAYHCGRLVAMYAVIQKAALGDTGVTVVSQYFAQAQTNPKIAIPQLQRLSNYHIAKIAKNSKGLAVYYESVLNDIAEKIQEWPKNFTLTEQAYFVLGYRHQLGCIYKKKNNIQEKEHEEDNI